MKSSYQNFGVLATLLVAIASTGLLVEVSNAQTICNVSIESLMTCRPSVTRPNPTPPSAACCSALSHADLNCLCSYKKSALLPSLGVDPNLAVQLPAKCHITHAPRWWQWKLNVIIVWQRMKTQQQTAEAQSEVQRSCAQDKRSCARSGKIGSEAQRSCAQDEKKISAAAPVAVARNFTRVLIGQRLTYHNVFFLAL